MRKIVFINRFFFPDHSATSQMLSDLVFGLVDNVQEHEIHIVASRQLYDAPDAFLPSFEILNSVNIHRVWSGSFGRQNLVGRGIDYLSFYLSATLLLLYVVTKNDVIVAKTDPPLLSVVCALVTVIKGAKLINWLQDLFPEVAAELHIKGINGRFYRILKSVRNWSMLIAEQNVVIGDNMAQRLIQEGIVKEKITVIHNWTDDSKINPIEHSQNYLRNDWGLEDKFVVGYSGNLGRSHDFSVILKAAQALKKQNNIRFLFIGGGAQLSWVKKQCEDNQLYNVLFKPYQPRNKLAESLSVADVHLISLKSELEGLIVPSKFYGICAAGRPVIFIGNNDGEIAKIIEKYGCGSIIGENESETLVTAINEYQNNHQFYKASSIEARRLVDSVFSFSSAQLKWKVLLKNMWS